MAREIRAEIAAETPECSFEDAIVALDRALVAFGARRGIESEEDKLAAGWSTTPEGHWIPPGYGPIPGWSPTTGGGSREDGERGGDGGPPADSV